MRSRLIAFALLSLSLAACSDSPTRSAAQDEPAFETVLESAGEGVSAAAFLGSAPESLRLTDAQRAEIRAINEAFARANAADLAALRTIVKQAMAARERGATLPELLGIFQRGQPIIERMQPAFEALRQSVNAVLTVEQRDWLRQNARRLGPQLPILPRRP